MHPKLFIFSLILSLALSLSATPDTLIINLNVPARIPATEAFANALGKAAENSGKHHTLIRLDPNAIYLLSRESTLPCPYFVSNTIAPWEAENEIKHVGILLKNIANLTIDGQGATILTRGEITPWVIDSCSNITLRNFSIDAIDPSVPEMTVETVTPTTFTAHVNPRSTYRISSGKLYWTGHLWEFTDGIAQIYNPNFGTSLRTASPVACAESVREIKPGLLEFTFKSTPADALPGCTYQMRHSFRTEVAGFINRSSNITLTNININFLGNFGIVSQTSRDICFRNLNFAPSPSSGRVNAGFADFLQVSGCAGTVTVDSCKFAGSHDDPINIHGTHLRIVKAFSCDSLLLRYMHPQTRGFQSFFPGDTVAITDSHTLLRNITAIVKSATLLSDTDIALTLSSQLDTTALVSSEAVVENITWTPEVTITNSSFTLTPTRAILVSTSRPVLIENNTFLLCPMPAILIADDARSWYESGPVKNLTIKGNRFIDCADPVIQISPENDIDAGSVHENITITHNFFNKPAQIKASGVKNLKILDNIPANPTLTLN